MNRTSIEWIKNPDGSQGYTWNPITGCLNHDNGLCKGGGFPCYALKLANGRLKPLYLANKEFACLSEQTGFSYAGKRPELPFYPRFWEERLIEPMLSHKPKGIFTCDMGDLFGQGIPEAWTKAVLYAISKAHYHRFYLLTKQPSRLIKFSPFPENCWVGMTLTDRRYANNARQFLLGVKAKLKFLSLEPLLGHMDGWALANAIRLADWLIIGACTGTFKEMYKLVAKYPELGLERVGNKLPTRLWTAQPKIEWLQEIVEAADQVGILVFLKDSLRPLLYSECGVYSHPWAFRNWQLRQEMPE